jgi:PPOX class probable F420-dependent enzyme
MDIEERRKFVEEHRTAVFGYNRRADGPSLSVVYYVVAGDDILISTMMERGKAKAVRRNPKVSLCVLDEKWPLTYLLVYCNAEIDSDIEGATEMLMQISGLMAGQPMPESVRSNLRKVAVDEKRVVMRLQPYQTFETPPRHVNKPEDTKNLTHWLGTTLPWKV